MNAADKPVPIARDSAARRRILLTAHDLFYRDGVRATGIDRVIAESGVTKATFYRHFPSKNDLVRAFLEYRHLRWMAWFEEALQRHGGGPAGDRACAGGWFRGEGFPGCASHQTRRRWLLPRKSPTLRAATSRT